MFALRNVRAALGVLLLALGLMTTGADEAQAQPLKGVDWVQPADLSAAEDALQRMRAAGVEAVRTGLITEPRLLTLADTLGIAFFQDLPVADLSAEHLRDTLAYARQALTDALVRATGHPSARHFGLARRPDTSDPGACAYFERLAAIVPDSLTDLQLYYTSPFLEKDWCRPAVDFVLLDVRNTPVPAREVERAQAASGLNRPFGALIGSWVRDDQIGLYVPHSPQAQARYLETHLPLLFADSSLAAIFVHRWQDLDPAQPDPDPFRRAYGLYASNGTPRPGAEVVSGLYTGTQTIFAFQAGEVSVSGASWMVLIGWGLVLMLGLIYALSSRFRFMVPRYFTAHYFYRESIREGRDVLPVPTSLLLVAIALGVGLIGALVADTISESRAVLLWLDTLPPTARETVVNLLNNPWLLVPLLGSLYTLSLAIRAAFYTIASRSRYPLSAGQALMLVVWPRWPVLLLAIAAVLITTLPVAFHQMALVILLGTWLLIAFTTAIRTTHDFTLITRMPFLYGLLAALSHPIFLVLVLGAVAVLSFGDEGRFLWHLATRQ